MADELWYMGFYIGHLHRGEQDRIRTGQLNPHERAMLAKKSDPWAKFRGPQKEERTTSEKDREPTEDPEARGNPWLAEFSKKQEDQKKANQEAAVAEQARAIDIANRAAENRALATAKKTDKGKPETAAPKPESQQSQSRDSGFGPLKFVGGLALLLVSLVGGISGAFQQAGVMSLALAHFLLAVTWFGVMGGALLMEAGADMSRRKRVRVIVIVGIIAAAVLGGADLVMVYLKRQQNVPTAIPSIAVPAGSSQASTQPSSTPTQQPRMDERTTPTPTSTPILSYVETGDEIEMADDIMEERYRLHPSLFAMRDTVLEYLAPTFSRPVRIKCRLEYQASGMESAALVVYIQAGIIGGKSAVVDSSIFVINHYHEIVDDILAKVKADRMRELALDGRNIKSNRLILFHGSPMTAADLSKLYQAAGSKGLVIFERQGRVIFRP